MEIKYSKKKQELRKDPILEFILRAKDVVVGQANLLTRVAVGLFLVIGGFMIYNSVKKSGQQKATEAFGKALIAYESSVGSAAKENENLPKAINAFKAVVDNNKGSPQAIYSAYLLGHIFLRQERYDEAITWFNAALSKNAGTDFVGASALEGLATCYESKGKPEEALNYLGKAILDDRINYRRAALEWKSALLNRDLKKYGEAKASCQKILADTVAAAAPYKQKAENLLTEMSIQEKS